MAIRRHGEAIRPDMRYRQRPGVYAVIARGDQALLTFQQQPAPEFQLPGGGIDAGESTLQALYREVFEETGWRVAAPRRLGAYRRFTYMPEYDLWAEKVCHIYLAQPVRRHGEPDEPGHAAVWAPIRLVPEMLASEGDRAFVLHFLDRFRT